MTKTMAEVLAEHHSKHYDGELGTVFCLDPTCSWDAQAHNFAIAADVFAQHQQDMLSAAGFGLVADAGAKALEDAAEELAQLPYVKPGAPGRAEYEMVLAVRRGMADAWLRARAAAVRGEG